jgi:hypothetical protein
MAQTNVIVKIIINSNSLQLNSDSVLSRLGVSNLQTLSNYYLSMEAVGMQIPHTACSIKSKVPPWSLEID